MHCPKRDRGSAFAIQQFRGMRRKSTYGIDKGDLWNKCGDKGTIITASINSGVHVRFWNYLQTIPKTYLLY